MIIDADCHISPTGEDASAITIEELLRRMDRSGVDKALTWLRPPYRREIDSSNAYVHKAMQDHPDRILGFGWADPNLGVREAKDTVRRCVEEYGFYGVKLNGAQNNFYIDDPKLSLPVVEEIAKTGKALAFHVGTDAYEETHPFRVAKIARAYPDLPILAVHMGGVAFRDTSNAAIEIAGEHPNITLIGSGVQMVSVNRAIRALGSKRVCFGSDTPFAFMHVQLAAYRALLEDFTDEDRENIMVRNIARVFDLKV
jgi:hypothetical protein